MIRKEDKNTEWGNNSPGKNGIIKGTTATTEKMGII